MLNVGLVSIWHVRGVTLLAQQLAAALDAGDFRTHVLARWEAERFHAGPPVEHARLWNGGDDPSPAAVVDWARDCQLDLVLFLEVHPNDWKRVDALQAAGRRVFALEHLDILRREHIGSYGRFDGFLHTSFHTAETFHRLHPHVPALNLPWGIPSPPVSAPPRRRRFLHIAGWGGLNNRKNTDGVIRAWERANPRDATLVLHTQAPLARYGDDCAAIVQRRRDITVHHGTSLDLAPAFATADVLLCPSKREGLGLPIVEALAHGRPVVVSDGYLMKQWLLPDEHGIICSAHPSDDGMMFLPEVQVDEAVLADAITSLANDPARLDTLTANVQRDRALWTWDWQPAALRSELRAMITDPTYRPDPARYVPEPVLAFERRRSGG